MFLRSNNPRVYRDCLYCVDTTPVRTNLFVNRQGMFPIELDKYVPSDRRLVVHVYGRVALEQCPPSAVPRMAHS